MSQPSPGGSPPLGGEDAVVLVPERSAVRVGKREVAVTPTQFRLLALLMAEPGRPFHRGELVERVMGTRVTERTVDVHVKELRRKLGPLGTRIEAVRGCGYRYRAEPPREVGLSA
jgi:two-component system, OmpR family, phosphate regulon response regulator PhoB